MKWLWLVILFFLACSDEPSAPVSRQWDSAELDGKWSGNLDRLAMVPNASFPYWPGYENHPLYNQRYDFEGVKAGVYFKDSEFAVLLLYRSDSLYFFYEERGQWRIIEGTPPQLRVDLTRISGRLETWDSQVSWDTTGCCWQAGLEIEDADPGSSGFGGEKLIISDIRGRVSISALHLERKDFFQFP